MKEAYAEFDPFLFGPIKGGVYFKQTNKNSPVIIDVKIEGVPPGLHGFHVHQKPMTSKMIRERGSKCCDLLGGHFNGKKALWSIMNPYGTPHGSHVGDLKFNVKSIRGKVNEKFPDGLISLYPSSPNCIIGKSIVLHKNEDDEGKGNNTESLITGNAGSRIACANIKSL